jgi:hypothetical protein
LEAKWQDLGSCCGVVRVDDVGRVVVSLFDVVVAALESIGCDSSLTSICFSEEWWFHVLCVNLLYS